MDVKGTTFRKKARASGETEGILVSGMSTVFVNDFKSPFKYQFDYCYEIKSKNANEKFFEPGDSGSGVYLIDRKGKKRHQLELHLLIVWMEPRMHAELSRSQGHLTCPYMM